MWLGYTRQNTFHALLTENPVCGVYIHRFDYISTSVNKLSLYIHKQDIEA